MSVLMCLLDSLGMTGIPHRVYSCLAPDVPSLGSRSISEHLLIKNEVTRRHEHWLHSTKKQSTRRSVLMNWVPTSSIFWPTSLKQSYFLNNRLKWSLNFLMVGLFLSKIRSLSTPNAVDRIYWVTSWVPLGHQLDKGTMQALLPYWPGVIAHSGTFTMDIRHFLTKQLKRRFERIYPPGDLPWDTPSRAFPVFALARTVGTLERWNPHQISSVWTACPYPCLFSSY